MIDHPAYVMASSGAESDRPMQARFSRVYTGAVVRLRDADTGRFISFEEYLDRQGEGVIIEGSGKQVGRPQEPEFIPTEYEDEGDFIEMDFDDMDMYP